MESKRLDNAALAAGISPNYINAHGKPQSISAETKRRLRRDASTYRHESGGKRQSRMSWFIPAAKNADGGGGQRRIELAADHRKKERSTKAM